MRIPRIFTDQALTPSRHLRLADGPSRHIAKVLRMQPGRELIVFNGQGGEYRACITAIGKRNVEVQLAAFSDIERESPLRITLGISISRGERMDWVIQKATEMGVAKIAPLFTDRTEVKLTGARLEKKYQHWQQVVISACEQCQRNRLAKIDQPLELHTWLAQVKAARKLVLHPQIHSKKLSASTSPGSVALLVGPEGGLGTEEVSAAEANGFEALALGPRVLRTETAPLVAISILQHLWGDVL